MLTFSELQMHPYDILAIYMQKLSTVTYFSDFVI